MAGNLVEKVKEFIGFGDTWEEEEEYSKQCVGRVNNSNVVSFNTNRQIRVVIAKPTSYEQVQRIAENLKERHPVIVNLENADVEVSRQIMDFLSGTIYALNGKMQKVSQAIFLFVPDNIIISDYGTDAGEGK